MFGSMPTHRRKRTKAEGKSRPLALPTHLGSRSKVNRLGRPYSPKKPTTLSKAVSALGVKVFGNIGFEWAGGARIDKIERLNDVLLLAIGVGRRHAIIFEVELHLFQRVARRQRLATARQLLLNPSVCP